MALAGHGSVSIKGFGQEAGVRLLFPGGEVWRCTVFSFRFLCGRTAADRLGMGALELVRDGVI